MEQEPLYLRTMRDRERAENERDRIDRGKRAEYYAERDFFNFICELRVATYKIDAVFTEFGSNITLRLIHYGMSIDYTIDKVRQMECYHDRLVRERYGDDEKMTRMHRPLCKVVIPTSNVTRQDANTFIYFSKNIDDALVIQ